MKNLQCKLTQKRRLEIGTKIVVRLDLDDAGQPYVISVPNYNRAPVLLGLLGVFAALLLLLGRKKGLMALLGLLYTLACVWFIRHRRSSGSCGRLSGRAAGRRRRSPRSPAAPRSVPRRPSRR